MATCPKCGAIWLWDWCYDNYVNPDGKEYEDIELSKDSGQWEASLIKCTCGAINAVMVGCECGAGPVNIKEWDNVDWEADENSYDTYERGK